MKKYICEVCGWVYDEESCKENGIPLVEFEDLPDDFVCPVCGVGKELFSEIKQDKNETQEKNDNSFSDYGVDVVFVGRILAARRLGSEFRAERNERLRFKRGYRQDRKPKFVLLSVGITGETSTSQRTAGFTRRVLKNCPTAISLFSFARRKIPKGTSRRSER